ncbi:hypothetical protein V6N13_037385 [Hibiscus sabdariffa]
MDGVVFVRKQPSSTTNLTSLAGMRNGGHTCYPTGDEGDSMSVEGLKKVENISVNLGGRSESLDRLKKMSKGKVNEKSCLKISDSSQNLSNFGQENKLTDLFLTSLFLWF